MTIEQLTESRGKAYGSPLDNFRRMRALFDAVAECPDPEVRTALEMIQVKVSRLIHKPDHYDSIEDIKGYAHTIHLVHQERARRMRDGLDGLDHPDCIDATGR